MIQKSSTHTPSPMHRWHLKPEGSGISEDNLDARDLSIV